MKDVLWHEDGLESPRHHLAAVATDRQPDILPISSHTLSPALGRNNCLIAARRIRQEGGGHEEIDIVP